MYSRGKTLIAMTNDEKRVDVVVEYLPFKPGQIVCNIFEPERDCLTVSQHGVMINLDPAAGISYKIYVGKDEELDKLIELMVKIEKKLGTPVSQQEQARETVSHAYRNAIVLAGIAALGLSVAILVVRRARRSAAAIESHPKQM